jgi:predicted TPR repeat methyltransferase
MSASAPFVASAVREAQRLVHAGRFVEGEARATRALQEDPRQARAHYVLGLASLMQQRPAEALARMERARDMEPSEAQFHFGLATCLAALARTQDAIEAYRRALVLRPAYFEAAANLGNLLERAGRFDEAADAYRTALAVRPDEPLVLNGLGHCELALKRHAAAAEALERALALKPDFASAMNNLSNAVARLGAPDRAIDLLRAAVALRPDFLEAWLNLGERLYMRHDDRGAVQAFERVLALDPSNGEVRYLRDTILGVAPERAPDDYVRRFFDRFAPDFDQRLTRDLEYRVPSLFASFLEPLLRGREKLRVVDLGCGTGLSGLVVSDRCAFLAGVDLSPKMLDLARERAIYDELAEEEIAAYLDRQAAASFDLALALDVLVYVGNIQPVMRAGARTLRPGGLFALSVERLDDATGYRQARTGRYAHGRAYVEATAREAGLEPVAFEEADLRKEDGKPVRGLLFALRKP